jgi:hypothetical protein
LVIIVSLAVIGAGISIMYRPFQRSGNRRHTQVRPAAACAGI